MLKQHHKIELGGKIVRVGLFQTKTQSARRTLTLRVMMDHARGYAQAVGAFDYYRSHPQEIPSGWKGKQIFSPRPVEGKTSGSTYYRYLFCHHDDEWREGKAWSGYLADQSCFVVVLAADAHA